jgi:glycosyltransferase involved in cell wall biosynthesis
MIYYDITDLLKYFERHPQVTGIQRVSLVNIREFLKLASTGAGESQFRLLIHTGSGFSACEASFFADETRTSADICAYFDLAPKADGSEFQTYINARYKAKWQRRLHARRLKLKNWLSKGKTFRQKGIGQIAPPPSTAERVTWSKADFNKNDVIFSSGANWVNTPFTKYISKLRSDSEIKFVQLVYDLIPVKNPEFLPKSTILLFEDWLVTLNCCADVIITNASVTRDDLITFAKGAQLPPFKDIRVVPLAHEFLCDPVDSTTPTLGNNAPYAKIRMPFLHAALLPFVLCVGTQEIRKNNWGLAQVWEELKRKRGYDLPRLIFVGRDGWRNDDFKDLLERSNNLNGYIVSLNDATDDELAYLYKNCLFSVFPSFAEGWGLPIGESLWFGRPVITSSISSMPEVAGAYADYMDPYALKTLEAAVEKMLDDNYRGARAAAIKSMSLRRWNDVADDIWKELHSLS